MWEHKTRKKKITLKIFLGVIVLLVLVRIALPYIVLHFANKKLARLDGYYGHIQDIDIALYRGAYVMKDIYIDKIDPSRKERIDFFSCSRIDLSVEWKALFKKKIVGEVEFEGPIIKYTLNKTIGKKADKDTTNFINLLKDFMPLRINRFLVEKGQIHYVDINSKPLVDIPLTQVHILGIGLTNESQQKNQLPASIDMSGNLYNGNMDIHVRLDPLNKVPTFDLDGTLTKTNLVNFNPFFTAYANFDLKQGNMSVYTEFAAKDNGFKGYVKPLIKDLDIVQFNKEEGGVLQIAWEAFVGSTAEILQNQPKGVLATKIPVEGKFTKPDVQVWDAIISILKNAFIEALKPSIDHTVNIYNVKQPEKKFILGIFRKKKN
ncbi:MAG: DUF748 domain-containing protein [Bacteroidota bacterium]